MYCTTLDNFNSYNNGLLSFVCYKHKWRKHSLYRTSKQFRAQSIIIKWYFVLTFDGDFDFIERHKTYRYHYVLSPFSMKITMIMNYNNVSYASICYYLTVTFIQNTRSTGTFSINICELTIYTGYMGIKIQYHLIIIDKTLKFLIFLKIYVKCEIFFNQFFMVFEKKK